MQVNSEKHREKTLALIAEEENAMSECPADQAKEVAGRSNSKEHQLTRIDPLGCRHLGIESG